MKAGLAIKAVASSVASENMARQEGIPIIDFSGLSFIDLAFDGADEVDVHANLIKGGGGALLREKIVAFNARQFLVIVDETKVVETLGKFPLPVEIVPFAADLTLQRLQQLDCRPIIRKRDGKEFITDNQNLIVDCYFQHIPGPAALNVQLQLIPGVVETGLFLYPMVSKVIIGHIDGRLEEKIISH